MADSTSNDGPIRGVPVTAGDQHLLALARQALHEALTAVELEYIRETLEPLLTTDAARSEFASLIRVASAFVIPGPLPIVRHAS